MTKFNITKREFDDAVERLRRHGRSAIGGHDIETRVWIATSLVLMHRHGIPEPWGGPSDAELAEVLTCANRRQRRVLKGIAEGITSDVINHDQYLAERMLRTKPTKH